MKLVLKVVFIVAVVIMSIANVCNSQKSVMLSDVAKENVEALANGEEVANGQPCIVGMYDRRGPEVTMCGTPCEIKRCLVDRKGICGLDGLFVLTKK